MLPRTHGKSRHMSEVLGGDGWQWQGIIWKPENKVAWGTQQRGRGKRRALPQNKMEGESHLSRVILGPPHACCGMCAYTHTHTSPHTVVWGRGLQTQADLILYRVDSPGSRKRKCVNQGTCACRMGHALLSTGVPFFFISPLGRLQDPPVLAAFPLSPWETLLRLLERNWFR